MGLFKPAPIRIRPPTGKRPPYLRKAKRNRALGPAFYAFAVVGLTLGAVALISDKDNTLAEKITALVETGEN